ncbi:unnamed protein product [Ectocarpus sp. 13 AM-2016]
MRDYIARMVTYGRNCVACARTRHLGTQALGCPVPPFIGGRHSFSVLAPRGALHASTDRRGAILLLNLPAVSSRILKPYLLPSPIYKASTLDYSCPHVPRHPLVEKFEGEDIFAR